MRYPLLEINLKKLKNNIDVITGLCKEKNINVIGVIKGFNAIDELVEQYIKSDVYMIASSRMKQIIKIYDKFKYDKLILIRIPMKSEIEDLVKYCSASLNSEISIIEEINKECIKQNKIHNVILMADLGDLREGFFDYDELVNTAEYIENNLKNIHLLGIGTNVGCYGSIRPTVKNLSQLVDIAEKVEIRINRKLEIISGGATSSLTLVNENIMPKRINNLRIGEAILLNSDLPIYWNCDIDNLYSDVFKLKLQVIELKDKPSYPIGDIFIDAFGNTPEYIDKGICKRAILAVGANDIGSYDKIISTNKNIVPIGNSSDHVICEILNNEKVNVGDIIEFDLTYASMMYLTDSDDVYIKYI